jgi:5-methylcytosine-specific restriction endonuclease McrA
MQDRLQITQSGKNTWKNTIAACDSCNQRKANRTPAEAGMVLRFEATVPTWATLARR